MLNQHTSAAVNQHTSAAVNLYTSAAVNLYTSAAVNLYTSAAVNQYTSTALNLLLCEDGTGCDIAPRCKSDNKNWSKLLGFTIFFNNKEQTKQ